MHPVLLNIKYYRQTSLTGFKWNPNYIYPQSEFYGVRLIDWFFWSLTSWQKFMGSSTNLWGKFAFRIFWRLYNRGRNVSDMKIWDELVKNDSKEMKIWANLKVKL